MTIDDLAWLRLAIQDRYRISLEEIIGLGNGARTRYQTGMAPVVSESEEIRVDTTVKARDVDYTIDTDTGLVTMTAAPSDAAEIIASYQWSAFSDAELNDLLDRYNTVTNAAIAALKAILADNDRFLKYTFGQESVDRTAARDAISDLIDMLKGDIGGTARLVKADTDARRKLIKPYMVSPYNDNEITD
ncbi:MAG: hypothetical protein GVY30_00170 [Chloroflexi bacterium]|jgi:hypothetical protein|nr:hypothetical protein [Chloroflexota bacterium]